MAYDYSNVLAAIAKGVDFNPLGNFSSGWQEGQKLNQAQQEIDNLKKYRDESLKVEQYKAENPNLPNEVEIYNWAMQDPNKRWPAIIGMRQAASPYTNVAPGGMATPKSAANERFWEEPAPGPAGPGGASSPSGSPAPAPGTVYGPPKDVPAATITGWQEAETGFKDLEDADKTLQEAWDLAPKAFSGIAAGPRAAIINGITGLAGDGTFDKSWEESAKATKLWQSKMTPKALQAMNKFMKPITEKENALSIETLADPNAPAEIKRDIIKMLRRNIKAEMDARQPTLEKWRREANPQRPGPGVVPPPGAVPPPAAGDPLQAGGNGPSGEAAGLMEKFKGRPDLMESVLERFMKKYNLPRETAAPMLGMQ